jgi:signal transduction histidine kinase
VQPSSTNIADAVLRAQAAAYTLVFAIQGPFLFAIFLTARTLRRPGMRAYTFVYALVCTASILSAVSVRSRLDDGTAIVHDVALALTMCALAAMWGANRVAAFAVSANPMRTSSVWLPAVVLAIVTTAFSIGAPLLPISGTVGGVLKSGGPRPAILFLLLACVVDAWRLSTTASRNGVALRLVALSFAALAFRQVYGLIASVLVYNGATNATGIVTFIQTSTTVLNGVALLAALMFEEQTEMALQAERVRITELRLARTQRLESLGRMAGGIAHDFANVLMVIQGGVTAARESQDLTTIDEHLVEAEGAVDRATGLTRQLALFARQRPPEVTTFAVASRLATIESLLRRLAGSSVALEIDCSTIDDARIAMDVSQFDQIFLNLVVNARDAMPNGGTLHMLARTLPVDRADVDAAASVLWDRFDTPPSGRVVSVSVRDTGSGIPADVIDRIFEPFYSTKGDRGTGLGLATVLSVVRSANGAVGVTSEVGRGSTFVVQLPMTA